MSLYVVSVVLALAVCWRLARLVPGGAQQFWLVLAGLVLPWGLIANILSIFHGLTPIGWVLAQAAIAASVFGSAHHWKWSSHPMVVPRGWNGPELALGGVLAAVLTALFMQQWSQPLSIGDDVRYHASRVLYWMGQQSIFPYTTHNDRQVYFAYQGELAFLWPILFTRMETAGRMIFWLASPFSCAALYMVARRVGASRTIALVVTIWFVVTPIVLRHGYGLKPEIWLTLYFLGAAWWLVEALETNRPADFILAGIFCTLAISSKLNLLAVVPALLAVPWITRGVTNPARSSRSLATGLVGASLLTGLALLLPVNMFRSGHPLGPAGMREVHSAPLSARQVRTHLARLPLLLFELPAMPWPEARAALENSGRSILAVMDADQPLPLERPDAWPGQFIFTVAPIAKTFSLGGIVLLLVLAFGAVRFGRELWRGRLISPQSAVWLLMASLLFGILLAVRWMVHSGLPERFLIPCFAVGMALVPGLIPERFRLSTLVAGLLLTAYYPVIHLVAETKRMWISPPTRDEISAPFTEALDQIPSGSSILFFGSNDAPDYPLFGAASGYDRGVTPWGKGPFDAAALDKIVEKKQITHMLFQDRRTAYFHWDPPLALGPFVEWASGRSGSRVTPLESPFMVLVATPRGQAMQSRVAAPRELLTEAPAERPLLSIDRGLRGVVGIEGDRIRTPWPIETLGTEKKGFLWMGSGPDEGIRFRVWTKEARTVSMMLRAEAGPSRTDALRTLALQSGGLAGSEQRQTFTVSGEVRFDVTLMAGSNPLLLYCTDLASVTSQANGDTRRIMVGLRDVAIGDAAKESGALVRGKGVAVDGTGLLRSAWAIENLGPPENEFLWLGSGETEGLGFGMTVPKSGVVIMRIVVSPGPSRMDRKRSLVLRVDGKTTGEKDIQDAGTLEFRVPTTAGRHEVKFYAKDPATVPKQANGDPRHLIVGLHEITVEAGAAK